MKLLAHVWLQYSDDTAMTWLANFSVSAAREMSHFIPSPFHVRYKMEPLGTAGKFRNRQADLLGQRTPVLADSICQSHP